MVNNVVRGNSREGCGPVAMGVCLNFSLHIVSCNLLCLSSMVDNGVSGDGSLGASGCGIFPGPLAQLRSSQSISARGVD